MGSHCYFLGGDVHYIGLTLNETCAETINKAYRTYMGFCFAFF